MDPRLKNRFIFMLEILKKSILTHNSLHLLGSDLEVSINLQ